MKNNYQGFTLVELLVVVVIIGVLAAVALPQYTTAVEKSRATEALTLMNAVAQAAQRYRLQKDEWPAKDAFDRLDIEVPKTNGEYGGKSFTLTMGNGLKFNPTDDDFVVIANRKLTGKKVYSLATVLREQNDGSVTMIRNCCPATRSTGAGILCFNFEPVGGTSEESEGQKYCDAITNGHNDNF